LSMGNGEWGRTGEPVKQSGPWGETDPGEVARIAHHLAVRAIPRGNGDSAMAEDLAQESLLRLHRSLLLGRSITNLDGWLRRVVKNLAVDQVRAAGRRITCNMEDRETQMIPSKVHAPGDHAAILELWQAAPELFALLPPPWKQVARLQYLELWTRREIIAWLCLWRPVAVETCRGILRQTHGMLRAIGREDDLRTEWPRRYSGRMNPWFSPPPPPVKRH
jgi:DNA-directed RNA polymerase specialized sigma24 family protein